MAVEVGYGLLSTQRVTDSSSVEDVVCGAVAQAVAAEEAGFDSVWSTEHHFIDDGHLSSPLTLLAAISSVTQRVALGTAVLLAPLHQRLRLLEDAALVQSLSRGRLVLGMGSGWRVEELEAFGVASSERFSRLRQATLAVEQWNAGAAVDGVQVTPRPSTPVAVWVGGHGPQTLALAGRHAAGYLGASGRHTTLAGLRTLRDTVDQARDGAGRGDEPFTFAIYIPTFVSDRPKADWPTVRDGFRYIQAQYDRMRHVDGMEQAGEVDLSSASAIDETVIFGRPAEVAERLLGYADVLGPDCHLILRSHLPGATPSFQFDGIASLGRDVAPLVRDRGAAAADRVGSSTGVGSTG